METVNRNIHALLNSIQKCQIYKDFKKQEEILNKNPELAERVQRFRAENFRLQNEEGQKDVLAKAEQLSRESEELRSFPEVNAYLDAELALCRMMQKICRTLTDGRGRFRCLGLMDRRNCRGRLSAGNGSLA